MEGHAKQSFLQQERMICFMRFAKDAQKLQKHASNSGEQVQEQHVLNCSGHAWDSSETVAC